ncbi:hypothetical protein CERZMDRAFT_83507 [Cercospora zeae-maydis SCOH1-5]|uniref:Uncharacterized protein n=1 Tax=Cercospora zeae-maydis SCOH1-5 TaxID=717836 RepID=A0A6A6FL04_9PEZI|nr:hypothetical protein CERZMDRAFT_83507 [Cercospora zeae-maydis SCOH1-5]
MSRDAGSEQSPLGERGMNVLPASEYLQERLQERRAQQLRPKRARHTDIGVQFTRGRDDDIFMAEADTSRNPRMYDSSPLAMGSSRASDAGSLNGDRRRRAPGVRDMDEQLDRLHKQNFALKLELDHRRELSQKLRDQMESMQEQVDRALMLEEEHKELLRINSELVSELEKRDRAVEEAMDIICDLEDQVGDLQERGSTTRPSTAQADSGYASTDVHDHDLRSSPPRVTGVSRTLAVKVQPPSDHASAASQKLQGLLNTQTPAKPKRQPSVLSFRQPSTQALRSVYLETSKSLKPVQSFQSLLEKQEARNEDESDDLPSSPRLSALSESSFPSIYSPKKAVSPDRYAWEATDATEGLTASLDSRVHMRQDSIKRVSQWMSERDAINTTPSRSHRISPPLQDESEFQPRGSRPHYLSLDNALATPQEPAALEPAADLQPFERRPRKQKPGRSQPRPLSYGGPVLSDHNMPPTPDSVSTWMLRESRSSIIKDKSPIDNMPSPLKSLEAPEPGLRTAPRQMRSSVELRTAYNSNLQFRNTALDGHHHDDSSDDDYVPQEHQSLVGDEAKGFPFDDKYDAIDGPSIEKVTPTGSQSQSRPLGDVMFNHNDISPTLRPQMPEHRRSSEQSHSARAKPRLDRMETSPTLLTVSGFNGGGRASVDRMTSPHSARSKHSNSSGNRTITEAEDKATQPQSPEPSAVTSVASPRSRVSASPARTLSKKMPGFIRRLSNTMTAEKPALPTLTTAPSSVYSQPGPPRPKTSHADRLSRGNSGSPTVSRPPSSRDNRPSPVIRATTDISTARPASAAATEKERRSLFKRSESVKKADVPPDASDPPARDGLQKRRGSIRDAMASRRPWR